MRRVTILKYAKELLLFDPDINYLCIAIRESIFHNLEVKYSKTDEIISELFPIFNHEYAVESGFATPYNNFVWFTDNKNRIDFINHLIDIYKDDETDIKKKYKGLIERTKML